LDVLQNINRKSQDPEIYELVLKGYSYISAKSNFIEVSNNLLENHIVNKFINNIQNANLEENKKRIGNIVLTTSIIANLSGSDFVNQDVLMELKVLDYFTFLFENNLNDLVNRNILITIGNLTIGGNENILKQIVTSKIIPKLMTLAFSYTLEVS